MTSPQPLAPPSPGRRALICGVTGQDGAYLARMLLIALKPGSVAETRDLDENTLLDLDAKGQVLAITPEHATARAELSSFSVDRVVA